MRRRPPLAACQAAFAAVFAVALGAPCVVGCAPRRPAPPVPALTQADWSQVRARLASLRATQSERPYVVALRVAMREPWTHRSFQGRGALAVQPHVAARMILVGPGGGTALDMWITRTRFRFVIPAAEFKRAGGASPEDARGLPVGFFRWWFLSPLEGRLLTAKVDRAGRTFVLREGGGTVTLRESVHENDDENDQRGREHLVALRREAGDVEEIEWSGRTLAPHAGDRARYVQDATGLEVDVLVEAVAPDAPDPAAFLDPDDPGVPL